MSKVKVKKSKNIKVTEALHKQIGELGKTTEDYGDVVDRVVQFYVRSGQNK